MPSVIAAPAHVSERKCAPHTMRENITKATHAMLAHFAICAAFFFPMASNINETPQTSKAFDVCPDGNDLCASSAALPTGINHCVNWEISCISLNLNLPHIDFMADIITNVASAIATIQTSALFAFKSVCWSIFAANGTNSKVMITPKAIKSAMGDVTP